MEKLIKISIDLGLLVMLGSNFAAALFVWLRVRNIRSELRLPKDNYLYYLILINIVILAIILVFFLFLFLGTLLRA